MDNLKKCINSVGISIVYSEINNGGGLYFKDDFTATVKKLFSGKRFKSICEICSGPGFIGYDILANNLCDNLTLVDIHGSALEEAKETKVLNNLTIATSNSSNNGFAYFIRIKGSILNVNGNFNIGDATNQYGFFELNADPSTPSARLDVFGNVTLVGTIGFSGINGTSRIYMRGTGTLSGGTFAGNGGFGVDVFIKI
jgi:hypothetical protein